MKLRARLIFPLLASALVSPVCHADSALHPGDVMPEITGESLSGAPLKLPADAAGKSTVIAFSFSKSGGKDSRRWNEHLAKDFGSNKAVGSFTVILLEDAPKFLRGMIVSGIKAAMPQEVRATTVILYQDEALWKARLGVSTEGRAYMVLFDAKGSVRWMSSGPFTDAEYAHLKDEIGRSPSGVGNTSRLRWPLESTDLTAKITLSFD